MNGVIDSIKLCLLDSSRGIICWNKGREKEIEYVFFFCYFQLPTCNWSKLNTHHKNFGFEPFFIEFCFEGMIWNSFDVFLNNHLSHNS